MYIKAALVYKFWIDPLSSLFLFDIVNCAGLARANLYTVNFVKYFPVFLLILLGKFIFVICKSIEFESYQLCIAIELIIDFLLVVYSKSYFHGVN